MRVKVEICVDSVGSAINAFEGGASRLELCSSLAEGGLTPSLGLLKYVKSKLKIPVFVLIRPRGGDFCYSAEEFEVMRSDICIAKENGADGFVLGALTRSSDVDVENCRVLIQEAHPLPVTFHRAFDFVSNPASAVESVVSLGCQRILTSGLAPDVTQGMPVLMSLIEQAAGRIIIMPGGGVREDNVRQLLELPRINEIHSSASSLVATSVSYYNNGLTIGNCETRWMECDSAKVKTLVAIAKEF